MSAVLRIKTDMEPEIFDWRSDLTVKSPKVVRRLQLLQKSKTNAKTSVVSAFAVDFGQDQLNDQEQGTVEENQPTEQSGSRDQSIPVSTSSSLSQTQSGSKLSLGSPNKTGLKSHKAKSAHSILNKLSKAEPKNKERKFEDNLRYEVLFEDTLGFSVDEGVEGCYVSSIDGGTADRKVAMYSTVLSINGQSVHNFKVDSVRDILSNSSMPCRVCFRKPIVETPYGLGFILNRNDRRLVVKLDFGMSYIHSDHVTKYTSNRNWTSFEESLLLQNAKDLNQNWDLIAAQFKYRSSRECRRRYEWINEVSKASSQDSLFNKLNNSVRHGDLQTVKRVAAIQPDLLDRADKNKSTTLFTAAWFGHCHIAEYLTVHGGVNVNHSNLKGNTSMHMCCEQGHTDIVRLLVQYDAHFTLNDLMSLYERTNAPVNPEVVRLVARAQLKTGEEVWYTHTVFGLVRAKVIERLVKPLPVRIRLEILPSTSPVFYKIRKSELETIATEKTVSILDPLMKPTLESVTKKPLKELVSKRQVLIDKCDKWDVFFEEHENDKLCGLIDEACDRRREEFKEQMLKQDPHFKVDPELFQFRYNFYLQNLRKQKLSEKSLVIQNLTKSILKHPELKKAGRTERSRIRGILASQSTASLSRSSSTAQSSLRSQKTNVSDDQNALSNGSGSNWDSSAAAVAAGDSRAPHTHRSRFGEEHCVFVKEHIRRFESVMDGMLGHYTGKPNPPSSDRRQRTSQPKIKDISQS